MKGQSEKSSANSKAINSVSNSEAKSVERGSILERALTGLLASVNQIAKVDFPVWHSELVTEDDDVTFLTHVRRFKLNADLFGWNDRIMAINFIFTLRGDIREYIDTLDDTERNSFEKLIKNLKKIYSSNKNINGKIIDLKNVIWDPETMSIRELAALIKSKMKLIGIDIENKDNELWLNDAFMMAVRDGDPVFAGWVELNKPQECSFSEFQDFMTNRYEIFKRQSTETDSSDLIE